MSDPALGLVPSTPAFGRSPGDRACLALALRHLVSAISADQVWARLDLPFKVHPIRPGMPS